MEQFNDAKHCYFLSSDFPSASSNLTLYLKLEIPEIHARLLDNKKGVRSKGIYLEVWTSLAFILLAFTITFASIFKFLSPRVFYLFYVSVLLSLLVFCDSNWINCVSKVGVYWTGALLKINSLVIVTHFLLMLFSDILHYNYYT